MEELNIIKGFFKLFLKNSLVNLLIAVFVNLWKLLFLSEKDPNPILKSEAIFLTNRKTEF